MSRRSNSADSLVGNMIKRGIVARTYFSQVVQKIQATMLDDDDVDEMPVYGPQGVSFRIPVDAEVLVANAMGDADLPCCIGTDQRGNRPNKDHTGTAEVPEGAGGLHYLGAWRVYVSDDGKVFLAGAADETEPALLGGTFVTLYDAHTHGSPFGPTTGPLVSAETAKSAKVFLV